MAVGNVQIAPVSGGFVYSPILAYSFAASARRSLRRAVRDSGKQTRSEPRIAALRFGGPRALVEPRLAPRDRGLQCEQTRRAGSLVANRE